MRVEGIHVFLTNILGQEIKVVRPTPSDDAQNYDLAGKKLTKDCSTCPAFIPREESLELLELGIENASGKYTPPNPEWVMGTCVWRGQKKLLYENPKGAIACGLIKRKL